MCAAWRRFVTRTQLRINRDWIAVAVGALHAHVSALATYDCGRSGRDAAVSTSTAICSKCSAAESSAFSSLGQTDPESTASNSLGQGDPENSASSSLG